MAADDARMVRRIPGRLAFGCTDLTLAWPHGGTGLGSSEGCTLTRFGGSYPVTIEAYGGEPVEYVEAASVWGLGCVLRTFNDDAVDLLFRNTTEGAITQRQVVTEPGAVRAGNWMSGRAVVLVFTPEGSTQVKSATSPDSDAPFVVLHAAIPMIQESAELRLEQDSIFGVPVLFAGIRDSSGNTMSMGPRVDLSL